MAEPNEEAAVNAMAAQVVYGDDDLKRDMEEFVAEALRHTLVENEPWAANLKNVLAHALLPHIAQMILTNYAHEIEKIVARYLVNKVQGDQY